MSEAEDFHAQPHVPEPTLPDLDFALPDAPPGDVDDLARMPAEVIEHLRLVATPAHVAMAVTRDAGPEVKWHPARHLMHINERVVHACLTPDQTFLHVAASVRHGKSMLLSAYLPFWYLGWFPDRRVILLSYNEDRASTWGEFTRELMALWGPSLFGQTVNPRTASRTRWTVKGRRGELIATGLAGTLTGVGADLCVTGDTLVTTERGPVPIARLHDRGIGTRVLSWDHDLGRPRWCPIIRTSRSLTDELVEVHTTSGRVLRCTPDHRVHVAESGYREAGALRVGDRLLEVAEEHPLPALRDGEGRARGDLPGVLRRGAGPVGLADLRVVRSRVHSPPLPGAQGAEVGPDPHLLRPDVQQCVDVRDPHGATDLSCLRCTGPEADPATVRLVHPESPLGQAEVRSLRLSGLRDPRLAREQSTRLLLTGVRQRGPLSEDDGPRELALPGRDQLRPAVQADATAGPRAGSAPVRGLWGHRAPARPPHRREAVDELPGEPHRPLPDGPPPAPQVRGDTVAMVRRVRAEGVAVYDLNVAGPHNFFAGGVLVHNCVIDDPIKNRKDADSVVERKALLEGYHSNVRTRLEGPGTVVLAMARWREDDLAGTVVHGHGQEGGEIEEILGDEPDEWEVINLPAIAEAPRAPERVKDERRWKRRWRDEIGRRDGEALWPEKWPIEKLKRLRATFMAQDPQTWDSLYQQRPTGKSGNEFKVDAWRKVPQANLRIEQLRLVRCWDLAASKNSGDWTVGGLIGFDSQGDMFVIDVVRRRLETHEVEDLVRSTAKVDGVSVPIRIEQEKAGSGKAVVAGYKRRLVGYDCEGVPPVGDKESRASSYAAHQQRSRVWLVEAEWNAEWIEEHRVFPKGSHDDMVDVGSAGFEFLADLGPSSMEMDHQAETPLALLYQQRQEPSAAGRGVIDARRAALANY